MGFLHDVADVFGFGWKAQLVFKWGQSVKSGSEGKTEYTVNSLFASETFNIFSDEINIYLFDSENENTIHFDEAKSTITINSKLIKKHYPDSSPMKLKLKWNSLRGRYELSSSVNSIYVNSFSNNVEKNQSYSLKTNDVVHINPILVFEIIYSDRFINCRDPKAYFQIIQNDGFEYGFYIEGDVIRFSKVNGGFGKKLVHFSRSAVIEIATTPMTSKINKTELNKVSLEWDGNRYVINDNSAGVVRILPFIAYTNKKPLKQGVGFSFGEPDESIGSIEKAFPFVVRLFYSK